MPEQEKQKAAGAAARLRALKAVAAGLAALPGPVDFAGVLAIADSLPVMIAYLDRGERYMFVNRTLADWLERPRRAILGKTKSHVRSSRVTHIIAGALFAILRNRSSLSRNATSAVRCSVTSWITRITPSSFPAESRWGTYCV